MKHWKTFLVASRSLAAVVRTTFLSDSVAFLCGGEASAQRLLVQSRCVAPLVTHPIKYSRDGTKTWSSRYLVTSSAAALTLLAGAKKVFCVPR